MLIYQPKKFNDTVIEHLKCLVNEGKTAREIAVVLNSTPGSIYQICSLYNISLKFKLKERKKSKARMRFWFTLDNQTANKLCDEADKRKITPADLIRLILVNTVKDNIISAVVDD